MSDSLIREGEIINAEACFAEQLTEYRTVPLMHEGCRDKTSKSDSSSSIRIGLMGAFAVGDELVKRMVLNSEATEYDISTSVAISVLGEGLDRLSDKYFGEDEYAKFALEQKKKFTAIKPNTDKARLVSGVQAMFDIEYGEWHTELIFSQELEEATSRVRDFCVDIVCLYPGTRQNEAVKAMLNPPQEKRNRITLEIAKSLLPDSIEKI